jgi:DNA-directed RNA polymerase specialized sigma24 family protein
VGTILSGTGLRGGQPRRRVQSFFTGEPGTLDYPAAVMSRPEGHATLIPTVTTDHRNSPTAELLAAIAVRDPLALAEAYHRTSYAAHACAIRAVSRREEVEGLLRAVYLRLWQDPPRQAPLEAWVRNQMFTEARAYLQERGRAAASPSTTLLLPDAPSADAVPDHTERLIAALDDDALRALLLAHDRGIPTADQRSEAAEEGLRRALYALAETDDPQECSIPRLADLVLGLLDDDEADRVAAAASAPACAEELRVLRRGRRRIEGLPPAPDLGHRVVAYAVTTPSTADRAEPVPGELTEPQDQGRADASGSSGPGAGRPAVQAAPAPASVLDGDAETAGQDEAQTPSALDVDLPGAAQIDRPSPQTPVDEIDRPSPQTPVDEIDRPLPQTAVDEADPPSPQTATESGEADAAPIRVTGHGGESSSWSRISSSTLPPAGELTLEGEGFEQDGAGGERRVLTVIFTILGALLLLGAGAVAGLLAIRYFAG